MNPHDNTKLFQLLEEYIQDNKYENYVKVASELFNGNAFLVLPSEHENSEKLHAWHPAPKGQKIKLGIYYVDGLKATAAFTSKDALYTWAKKPTECVSLSSQAVIEMCEVNHIDRIVVDSGLRTMVVLQRNHK